MAKETTKDTILSHAARIIHKKGFNNTGITEIVQSAGVPKGSFYFYFRSKDELGLALVDYYFRLVASMGEPFLRDAKSSPLKRLENFFDGFRALFEREDWMSGCPLGNLTQEMGTLNPAFRTKLRDALNRIKMAMAKCLEQARAANEIGASVDPDEMADFILNSWEGALLRMKAEGDTEPLGLFRKVVFGILLKRPSN